MKQKIKNIGIHRVMHSDLMLADFDELMQGEMVDVMYSDPPWGVGNLKYWQTMNKKMTGANPNDVNLDSFLDKIFSIAEKYVKEHIFIEYGEKWHDEIKALAKKHNLVDNGTIKLRYQGGGKLRPLDLHLFGKRKINISESYIKSVTDTYGYNTLVQVMKPFAGKGKTIIDPCCGMGYTAQIAIDNGMKFIGNELNEARLNKTIKRLSK